MPKWDPPTIKEFCGHCDREGGYCGDHRSCPYYKNDLAELINKAFERIIEAFKEKQNGKKK